MKKFSQLITLFPCHSLEDFPVHGSKADAKSLLAAWTGLWHPSLIANSGVAPTWRRADDTVASESDAQQYRATYVHQHYHEDEDHGWSHDSESEFDEEFFQQRWRNCLVVVPDPAEALVFKSFRSAAEAIGATVIGNIDARSSWLSGIGIEEAANEQALVDDFFALGYIRLQIEMMTRKLRYSSDLDNEKFNQKVISAAQSSVEGNVEACEADLQSAFDLLAEEKNRYYPVSSDLIDLVLTTPSIKPESIEAELDSENAATFLMSGHTVREVARRSDSTTEKLKSKLFDSEVSIVGGPEIELPENLLHVETSLSQIKKGLATYDNVLEQVPAVFLRRRFGLHQMVPVILEGLEFQGAMHVTFDRGSIPTTGSNSIRWMGPGGSAIMATTEKPLDAASDKSFLDLGVRIGSDLDSAHVSTVSLARWPTQTCDSLNDLRNSLRYGNLLGNFVTADSWFENAYDPGYGDSFDADEYCGPWLKQAIESGSTRPVSTFVNYWRRWYQLSAIRSMLAMTALKGSGPDKSLSERTEELQMRLELATADFDSSPDHLIEDQLNQISNELRLKFCGSLVNTVPWRSTTYASFQCDPSNKDVFLKKEKGPLRLAAVHGKRCDMVTELQGFGSLTLDPENLSGAVDSPAGPAVDDGESTLRNEFFEVRVDSQTGSIHGVYFYGKRGNLLSQKIAIRSIDPDTSSARYTTMVCDSLNVTRHSPIASEIRTQGRLIDDSGDTKAGFTQTIGLRRGRSVIDLAIELSDVEPLDGTTGNYVAHRIAWSDESAELYCDIQGTRQPVRKPEIEAPHFVEVQQAENHFALLTHGLPWHRRTTKKTLDSILMIGREKTASFKMGIAINPDSIMQIAVAEMHPRPQFQPSLDTEPRNTSWLLHLANRNVVVSHISPIYADGNSVGLRVRLQETEGKRGKLKLYCKRRIVSAQSESFRDEYRQSANIQQTGNGSTIIETPFSAYDYFQLGIFWSDTESPDC